MTTSLYHLLGPSLSNRGPNLPIWAGLCHLPESWASRPCELPLFNSLSFLQYSVIFAVSFVTQVLDMSRPFKLTYRCSPRGLSERAYVIWLLLLIHIAGIRSERDARIPPLPQVKQPEYPIRQQWRISFFPFQFLQHQ